ncbi:Maf family protein, partial [Acinetobacter baumannii]
MAHLVLASSSPRRRELLQQLGLNFEIYSPDI